MLMKIGTIEFDLRANIDRATRETTRDYVEKPVIGAMPPLEDVGQGPETLDLSGRLLPRKLGGLDAIAALQRMQATGLPQLVVRGDGAVLGFYAILSIGEAHSFLDREGVGQVVDVTFRLQKSSAVPTGASYFASLVGLI